MVRSVGLPDCIVSDRDTRRPVVLALSDKRAEDVLDHGIDPLNLGCGVVMIGGAEDERRAQSFMKRGPEGTREAGMLKYSPMV